MSFRVNLEASFSTLIHELDKVCTDAGFSGLGDKLGGDIDEALGDSKIRVVVVGEWSCGKSSLINALFGATELLPVGVNPTTSYITLISTAAKESITVHRDSGAQSVTRDELHRLVAESERDPAIDHIEIAAPASWADDALIMIDTPGLEDLDQSRSDVTLRYLPKADVVVLVLDAVPGIKGSEQSFVQHHLTPREVARTVCVINKIDLLPRPADIDDKLLFCRRSLEGVLPGVPWHAVSSYQAIEVEADDTTKNTTQSGIKGLRDEIIGLVRRDRAPLMAMRFKRLARLRVDEILAHMAAEEACLGLPVAEAEQAVTEFKSKLDGVRVSNRQAFDDAKKSIEHDLEPWLKGVPARVESMIAQVLDDVDRLDGIDALRTYIKSAQLESSIAQNLRQLADEMGQQLNQMVTQATREALGEKLGDQVGLQINTQDLVLAPDTIFTNVPEIVAQLVDVLLIDLLAPGGLIAALFARLGLAKLLEGRSLPLLEKLLPSNFIKTKLQQAISESVAGLPERVSEALSAAALCQIDKLYDEINDFLNRRLRAVETGMEAAVVELKKSTAQAETRKTKLAAARATITALGERHLG